MNTYVNDGLTFDVLDGGPRDATPVVLLHGFPANASSWDGVVPALHAAGYRTLVPNQRGYSPGARPRGRRAYRLPMLVADVVALINASEARAAHVVGHDWGGGVAWDLAATHPDRVATVTAVSTPHPRAFLASMVRSRQAMHSWYMLAFQLPAVPERSFMAQRNGNFAVFTQLRRSGLPEAVAQNYVDHLSAPGALTGALNWYRAIPLVSPRRITGRISVPTLYVWGSADPFLGATAARLTERYVDGPYRFEALTGSGHWIPEAEPDRLAALIAEHIQAARGGDGRGRRTAGA